MKSPESHALMKRLFEDNSVKNIKFFPGTDADSTPEDFARGINMFFAEAEVDPHTFSVEQDVDN